MKNEARETLNRLKESNAYELENRKDLPDLLEAFMEWKKGNKEVLQMFFYQEKKVKNNYSYHPETYSILRFWDGKLNNKLYKLRQKFLKVNDVDYGMMIEGKPVNVRQRHVELTENDFMERFYEFLLVENKARNDGKCFAD